MHRASITLVLCLFAMLSTAVPVAEPISEEDLRTISIGRLPPHPYDLDMLDPGDPDCEKNLGDIIEGASETAACLADPECKKKMDEDTGKPRTVCESQGIPKAKGYIPKGSAHFWNVGIKAEKGDNVLCKCLKGEIKKQSGCAAMVEWECTNDPITRETAATFFQSIFCDAQHMVKAIEARTHPKIAASCINIGDQSPGLGHGVDVAMNALFLLLGGAISKKQ